MQRWSWCGNEGRVEAVHDLKDGGAWSLLHRGGTPQVFSDAKPGEGASEGSRSTSCVDTEHLSSAETIAEAITVTRVLAKVAIVPRRGIDANVGNAGAV